LKPDYFKYIDKIFGYLSFFVVHCPKNVLFVIGFKFVIYPPILIHFGV